MVFSVSLLPFLPTIQHLDSDPVVAVPLPASTINADVIAATFDVISPTEDIIELKKQIEHLQQQLEQHLHLQQPPRQPEVHPFEFIHPALESGNHFLDTTHEYHILLSTCLSYFSF